MIRVYILGNQIVKTVNKNYVNWQDEHNATVSALKGGEWRDYDVAITENVKMKDDGTVVKVNEQGNETPLTPADSGTF